MNELDTIGEQVTERPDPARGARILVLDDHQDSAELVGKLVRLMGHYATVCTSPRTAMHEVDQRHFDLILTDFHMPELNGEQFYWKVMASHPELAGHMVFLTGDSFGYEVCHFFASTHVPHLDKPCSMAVLRRVINEHLSSQ